MRGGSKAVAVLVLVAAVLAAAVLAVGCGRGGPADAGPDPAPFEAAIARYLQARHMDMRVAEFRSLEVDDDAAAAVCKMEDQSGLYGGVGVTWRFTFARDAQGGWAVQSRETQ